MVNETTPSANKPKDAGRDSSQGFPDMYGESALWDCLHLKTGVIHPVNGVLAQILKRYPSEYQLTFLSATGMEIPS